MTHFKGSPPKTESGGIDDLPKWARHEIKKLRLQNGKLRIERNALRAALMDANGEVKR